MELSFNGPEPLNNAACIAKDGGNCFRSIVNNINMLQQNNYPFAFIAVLDERVIDFDMTIKDISDF